MPAGILFSKTAVPLNACIQLYSYFKILQQKKIPVRRLAGPVSNGGIGTAFWCQRGHHPLTPKEPFPLTPLSFFLHSCLVLIVQLQHFIHRSDAGSCADLFQ